MSRPSGPGGPGLPVSVVVLAVLGVDGRHHLVVSKTGRAGGLERDPAGLAASSRVIAIR
ncbi:hypothetical protein [Amycolatopsis sp. PS_44_ISF1]|uniref:hypothetical protein n=1 Tax=Amycolatopsis sp. PS_44_ISF1 TaxID=2974917 RepID=UPI0028DE1FEA|nr:hypothetical protein [Amycolatopsis sp. PS_44_ISF1]MDT8912310.1 hypothetical protein [Amycolatopsis sp. PS_44_ISF1]